MEECFRHSQGIFQYQKSDYVLLKLPQTLVMQWLQVISSFDFEFQAIWYFFYDQFVLDLLQWLAEDSFLEFQ